MINLLDTKIIPPTHGILKYTMPLLQFSINANIHRRSNRELIGHNYDLMMLNVMPVMVIIWPSVR